MKNVYVIISPKITGKKCNWKAFEAWMNILTYPNILNNARTHHPVLGISFTFLLVHYIKMKIAFIMIMNINS